MNISGEFHNKPIKGKKVNTSNLHFKAETYGYAALYIAIIEHKTPEIAHKTLTKRLKR